jgi:hypothetical protein
MLAQACTTSQQRISQILVRQGRPAPGSDLAEMLALATEGLVTGDAWLLPIELQAREERREQARQYARRFASGELVASPTGRLSLASLGRYGKQLGLGGRPAAGQHAAASAPLAVQEPAGDVDRGLLAKVDTAALVAELSARLVPGATSARPTTLGKE